MPRTSRTLPTALGLAATIALTAPASAHIADGWPMVAAAGDAAAGCALTVTGNGQAYRIAATGFRPASTGHLFLANADMRPLDRPLRLDGAGDWSDYYLPFLWHRDGGVVTVSVTAPGCSLTVDFPWKRAGPVTR